MSLISPSTTSTLFMDLMMMIQGTHTDEADSLTMMDMDKQDTVREDA